MNENAFIFCWSSREKERGKKSKSPRGALLPLDTWTSRRNSAAPADLFQFFSAYDEFLIKAEQV